MTPADLDHDTPPRSDRLTDEEVEKNQADRERQNISRQDAMLRVIGARRVRVEALPAGPGVLPSEVGRPGPYFGIEFANGEQHGWWRDDKLVSLPPNAMALARDRLVEIAIAIQAEPSSELELESARRVANACVDSRHGFSPGGFGPTGPAACPSCIAAYAQQIRADRRNAVGSLNRWTRSKADAVAKLRSLVEVVQSDCALGFVGPDSANDYAAKLEEVAKSLEVK